MSRHSDTQQFKSAVNPLVERVLTKLGPSLVREMCKLQPEQLVHLVSGAVSGLADKECPFSLDDLRRTMDIVRLRLDLVHQ